MRKVYHLSTCGTCKRILGELNLPVDFELQDVKKNKITESQLEEMKALAGSYEALFSKISRNYKALGLKDKALTEADYRNYLLTDYTMLKRPVFIIDGRIFIGNAPKTVEEVKSALA